MNFPITLGFKKSISLAEWLQIKENIYKKMFFYFILHFDVFEFSKWVIWELISDIAVKNGIGYLWKSVVRGKKIILYFP